MATKKATKTTARVSSILQKTIVAVNKADKVISEIPKTIESIELIKQEVQTLKNDMDLGLTQYEQAILEKEAVFNAGYDERIALLKTQEIEMIQGVSDAKDAYKKELSELDYNNNLAIERKSIETAENIVNIYGKVIVEQAFVEEVESNIEKAVQEITELKDKELRDKSRGHAIAENKIKSDFNIERIELSTKLSASENRVDSLLDQITYLKEQVELAREQSISSLQASHSEVVVNNDNTGKK